MHNIERLVISSLSRFILLLKTERELCWVFLLKKTRVMHHTALGGEHPRSRSQLREILVVFNAHDIMFRILTSYSLLLSLNVWK